MKHKYINTITNTTVISKSRFVKPETLCKECAEVQYEPFINNMKRDIDSKMCFNVTHISYRCEDLHVMSVSVVY